MMLGLATRSLWNRRLTAGLTLVTIALSVTLLLGVERLRNDARSGFANTVSGTDLIVGARSGAVQLLLYSVFRIGDATNNLDWRSYLELARHPRIAWTVPLSLGDSHRGFRVLGTTPAYFEHYRYGRKQPLRLARGRPFDGVFEAVLGAQVAEQLGYRLEQRVVVAHGAGKVSLRSHEDRPFQVVGILEPTGTPVDRTVHVSLQGIEAIHLGWEGGAPLPGLKLGSERVQRMDLTPKSITAFLVGLKSKLATFRVQREVNKYAKEPLLAILPGVALQQLWGLVGVAESALLAISGFVVLVGLAGMLTVLLAGLDARRREMAILRSVGAGPHQILGLIMGEAALLTATGIMAGLALLYALLLGVQPLAESQWGLHLSLALPNPREWLLLGIIFGAGLLSGLLPAWLAYRHSLADGLSIRL